MTNNDRKENENEREPTRAPDDAPRIPAPREPVEDDDEPPPGISRQAWVYWGRQCAKMPPMSPDAIAALGLIFRELDQQRSTD
ncbi:hypothetical protein [Amycolatopsis sp. lyj-108]|uniref:hypothetical protein n=1 Tax=Amycolatopsis sp. lyj-108 TaxID=2789286 RepID=UPI00397809DB